MPFAQTYSTEYNSHSADEAREPTVSFVPLFGAPPKGMEDIYLLYAKQLALHIYSDLCHPESMKRGDTCKPLVIALALDRMPTENVDDIDFVSERQRLDQICSMMQECRVW
jgi:hypothetical protein